MNVYQSYRFLLARLHLDSLAGETTAKSIKYTLENLKTGARSLTQAYEDAIKRIESQTPARVSLAKEVLSWIIIAKRPLTARELQHALAIEIGETELDEDNIPEIAEIVSVCAGLVVIDKQSDIIRPVHYTTQEFFELVEKAWIPQARSMIVNKCVTYLSFDTFLARLVNSHQLVLMLAENPFLNYAALYWGVHAFQLYSEEKSSAIVETHELALRFLQNESLVQSCTLVQYHANHKSFFQYYHHGGAGLHMAAFFGLAHLCAGLLEQQDDTKVEADPSNEWERTPLSYAAQMGHVAVVKLLLERADVDINYMDSQRHGPLSYAAMEGHEAVVKLLLERADIDINRTNVGGDGPLSYAARRGHVAVVKLMLAKDGVDVNSKNRQGDTPLSYAAEGGHVALVKLLLERADIDVNCKGDNGFTPLIQAVIYEHEAVVKTLLERPEIDAEYRDWRGWTPLRCAEVTGHKGIVKLLKDHIASH